MGVGHVALALGASKAAPRVNVGWLVFAAMLADFLLGVFAALGLEHSTAPADYASKHYLLFNFPYSHGLVALCMWGLVTGFLISRAYRFDSQRVLIVIALVVFSHFVLDGLVHVAGLPLLGENSPKLGLGLWTHMPLELGIETAMSIVGIAVYWKLAGSRSPAVARWGMAVFVALVTALTWAQLAATEPPTSRQLIGSWLIVPVVFSVISYVLDRGRVMAARA
jgi:hypothetical protein